jgi:hypothetical protein
MTTTATPVLLRIEVPQDLLTHYEALASITGKSVDETIVEHLRRTRDHQADDLHVDTVTSAEIRRLLGGGITTGAKLLDMIRRLLAVKLVASDGKSAARKVELSPAQVEAAFWWIRNSGYGEEKGWTELCKQAFGLLLKC